MIYRSQVVKPLPCSHPIRNEEQQKERMKEFFFLTRERDSSLLMIVSTSVILSKEKAMNNNLQHIVTHYNNKVDVLKYPRRSNVCPSIYEEQIWVYSLKFHWQRLWNLSTPHVLWPQYIRTEENNVTYIIEQHFNTNWKFGLSNQLIINQS